jgi:molybdopterin synthase sulfur carrier subunit
VVRLASALVAHAGERRCVELDLPEPVRLGEVIDALCLAHPAVGRRVRDETGILRRHVNVFVGGDNARDLDDMGTILREGTEVAVLPAISGG